MCAVCLCVRRAVVVFHFPFDHPLNTHDGDSARRAIQTTSAASQYPLKSTAVPRDTNPHGGDSSYGSHSSFSVSKTTAATSQYPLQATTVPHGGDSSCGTHSSFGVSKTTAATSQYPLKFKTIPCNTKPHGGDSSRSSPYGIRLPFTVNKTTSSCAAYGAKPSHLQLPHGAFASIAIACDSVPSPGAAPFVPETYEELTTRIGTNFNTQYVHKPQQVAGITPLHNLINSCFFNASLQCLMQCTKLTDYVLSAQYKRDINRDNTLANLRNGAPCAGQLITQLHDLFHNVFISRVGFFSPYKLKLLFGEIKSEFYNNRQEDAHEFMTQFIDSIHEDVNKISRAPALQDIVSNTYFNNVDANNAWTDALKQSNSIIIDLIQGQYSSSMKCIVCHTIFTKYETFKILSLPLGPFCNNIYDCFDKFCATETIPADNDWKCSFCSTLRAKYSKILSHWLRIYLPHVPDPQISCTTTDVFVLSLNRFNGGSNDKNDQPISSPLELNLSTRINCSPYFDLFAIVNHVGASRVCGHYTATIKNPSDKRWYRVDDVKKPRSLRRCTVVNPNDAYILFYRRRNGTVSNNNGTASYPCLISHVMHQPMDTIVSNIGNEQLHVRDLSTLNPNRWLNDTVINSYFHLLQIKYRNFYFFTSHFFKQLTKNNVYNYSNVIRWTRAAKLAKKSLPFRCILDCERVFVPLHIVNHWILAVIVFKDKCITFYDSIRGSTQYQQIYNVLMQYIIDEHGARNRSIPSRDEWSLANGYQVQQNNNHDCGVWTIIACESIACESIPIESLSVDAPIESRQNILARLIFNDELMKTVDNNASDGEDNDDRDSDIEMR